MNGFEFIFELPVFVVLQYVIGAILVNTVLRIILAFKKGEFSFAELPRFLATNVAPYSLALIILAVMAEYQAAVWNYFYYAASAAVLARYVAKIYGKFQALLGITVAEKER